MIELVLLMCLVASPAECREERMSLVSASGAPIMPTLMASVCGVAGPQEAARWESEHPAWKITGWRCGPAGRDA